MISVFPPKISDQVLAFDTNIVLLFLVRNESLPLRISFIAVALDFQVFLAQTIRLKKSNSKEPEWTRVVMSVGFSFFSIWFSVCSQNWYKRFFGFGIRCGFRFFLFGFRIVFSNSAPQAHTRAKNLTRQQNRPKPKLKNREYQRPSLLSATEIIYSSKPVRGTCICDLFLLKGEPLWKRLKVRQINGLGFLMVKFVSIFCSALLFDIHCYEFFFQFYKVIPLSKCSHIVRCFYPWLLCCW